MLHAVQAPILKLAAVAGSALLIGQVLAPPRDPAVVQRLQLHAPKRAGAIYETAWSKGDVRIRLRDGVPAPRAFQKRSFHYGCEWLSIETLTPQGPNRYFYTYDEEKLWCAEDAPPSITTPRTGYALVVDTE
jgi:hypothetical protein